MCYVIKNRLFLNMTTYSRQMSVRRKEDNELTLLHSEIKILSQKMDRVLRTLIGDEEMAQEGLVTKVQKHEEYIQSQKLLMAKVSGIAIGSGVLSNWVFDWLSKLL
jgi:hypothetical protein